MMKNLKKLMALVLAMTMCASMMSVQAFAAEIENDPTESVVSVPEGPGDGSAEVPEVTVTVTVQEDGRTTTTTTQTDWSGETEVPSETGEGEGDGTITTVTGTQTNTETETVDGKGRPVKQTGHVEGSETTRTETTETQVTEDVILDKDVVEVDESTDPVTTPEDPQIQWETDENGQETWAEGQPDYEDEWETVGQETVVDETTDRDGWKVTEDPDPVTRTEEVTVPDPLAAGNVTLELTPGGVQVRVEESITVEEILMANDDWNGFDYGVVQQLEQAKNGTIVSDDGKVTTEAIYGKDGITIIGYKVTTVNEVTVPGTPGEPVDTGETREDEKHYTTVKSEPVIADDWNKDAGDILNEDGEKIGSVVMTKEPIYGEDGKTVIGYTITKTTTTDYDNTQRTEATGETTSVSDPVKTGFALPEKPVESEKTENGVTTKVVVEEAYDEDGNHVGYITTTVRTDAHSGRELYRAEETIYGTSTAIHVTTTTDPTTQEVITDTTTVTTEVTEIYGFTQFSDVDLEQQRKTNIETTEVTDTEIYQLLDTGEGKFFIYKGTMYAVVAEGKHGTLTDNVDLDVDLSEYPARQGDIRGNPGDGGGYTGQVISDGTVTDSNLRHIGYGLYSDYLIRDEDGYGHDTRQYALKDKDGNIHYVYCVELGTGIKEGSYYAEDEMSSGYLYGDGNGNVSKISSVANNGFWGTTEGIGSLDAVKDLLRRNGYSEVAESLTAGQALTATQAAIWEYGTDGDEKVDEDNLVNIKFTYENGTPGALRGSEIPEDEIRNIQVLRDLLVDLAENTAGKGVAEKIDVDDITAGAIKIKSKETENPAGNDTYNTDLSFTLAVSTSSINGDLIVHVIQGDQIIETRRLAGSNSSGEDFATIQPDANGTYTIPNVVLAENVTITLNLEGTQHLADGVYIYKSANYQDFVGLSKQEHAVDLSVDMVFSVEADPPAQMEKTTDTLTKEKTEILTEKRHGSRVDTRTGITEQTTTASQTTGTVTTLVYADVTVTEVTVTESGREWTEDWEKTYSYPVVNPEEPVDPVDPVDPDIPDEPIPTEPEPPQEIPPVDIPDQEIPLEDVPKTGDVNALWLGLTTLLSGGGLVGLLSLGRKGREDA